MSTDAETTGILRIDPYLYYEDVSSALGWLAAAFGFREMGERNTENGVVTHAAMAHDGGVFMMGFPGPQYRNPAHSGQRTCDLYVHVADVDTHFQRARAAGAKIIEEPTDTEYGHRRYTAEDLEGHHWTFAKPIS